MEENKSDSERRVCSVNAEPPDIRNWFSSYKYESFQMDTHSDAFGSSAFEESDCDGDGDGFVVAKEKITEQQKLGEFGRNCDGDDEQEDQDLSRIPDSADSLAPLSEPPHIKNWFSSYVYESPVVDTVHDLKLSVADGSECEEEGFAYEKSNSKREDDPDEHRQNHNSSDSSTLLSEPPDIRNWFFSYEYESPEGNNFVDEETQGEEDDFVNQQHSKAKDDNLCKFGRTRITASVIEEKFRSNRLQKFNRLLRDKQEYLSLNKKASGGESSCNEDNLCCEGGTTLENKTYTNLHISSTKELEKTILNEQQQKQTSVEQANFISCKRNTNSSNNIRISPPILRCNQQTEDVSSHVAGESMGKSNGGSHDKENEGKGEMGHAFVTTKRNRVRSNDENYLAKPQTVLSECSRKKRETASDGNVAMKRKVLSERTNLELEHTVTIEVTGKWRCPQKSKPNTGPPLKQLRLERWVHRLH